MSDVASLDSGRVHIIDENTIKVSTRGTPKLPFDGAGVILLNFSSPLPTVEKRRDGLYVDGVKIDLYFDDSQEDGNLILGHKLGENLAVANRTSVHPNVMDAIVEMGWMPDDWKFDENGNARLILSFAVVYPNRHGDFCVRFWYWGDDGRWQSNYDGLNFHWVGAYAALLAR